MWDRNQTRGGRHTPDGVCTGNESLEKERTTGSNSVTGGLKTETSNIPPVLHSWPGLQGFPCSEGLFMSLQQSIFMSSIIAMPMVFMGQGSVGA